MARAFAEPATTWRGAFLRAAIWSGPHVCGSFMVGQLLPRPWREHVMLGLLLGVVPMILAVRTGSWRVGVASASVASALIAAAMAIVAVMIRAA